MKKIITEVEERNQAEIEAVLDYITTHPETGGKEFKTVKCLCDFLRESGFAVEENYLGYETGFKASLKNGEGAKIGFLAKYDAIPGFDENGNDAHGCGHNWIAALCAGVGRVLSQMTEQFSGEIVVVGAPPEVFYGERIGILTDEAWKEFDAVFSAHLNDKNVLQSYPLPVNTIEIEFEGRASQAFSFPRQGINALDPAINSIIRIRKIPLEDTDRISVNICDGGTSTEMIPSYSRLRVATGALEKERADKLTGTVLKIALEESQKAGTSLRHHIYNEFLELKKVPALYSVIEQAFQEFDEPYDMDPDKIEESRTALDISPVSHLCPLLFVFFGVEGWTAHQPTIQRIKASYSQDARDRLHSAIRIFAYAALRILNDPEERDKVACSFRQDN